jgi:parvulin-like peptidyl-prolyl isomerase
MKKISKKTVSPVKTSRRINFYPIFALIAIIGIVYAYYRFGIVATVNGIPISRTAYLRNLEKLDKKLTVRQMANEALVFQEASKKGVSIDKSAIDTEIATIEAQIETQGQSIESALAAEGMTLSDLEDQIRIQLLVEKLANPNIDITQAQIDDFVKVNKSSYPTTYTKEQLETIAKDQLISEAKNTAINNWFTELQKTAKIIIR